MRLTLMNSKDPDYKEILSSLDKQKYEALGIDPSLFDFKEKAYMKQIEEAKEKFQDIIQYEWAYRARAGKTEI